MRSLLFPVALAVLFLSGLAIEARADQAKVEPGATLAELQAGTHLFGPEFSAKEMLGKVVVVNIGGA